MIGEGIDDAAKKFMYFLCTLVILILSMGFYFINGDLKNIIEPDESDSPKVCISMPVPDERCVIITYKGQLNSHCTKIFNSTFKELGEKDANKCI